MREPQAAMLAEDRKARSVTVETSARACINCQYYEPYYHRNRGNIATWIPTDTGYCLLKECRRGALRQTCKNFLKEVERSKKK